MRTPAPSATARATAAPSAATPSLAAWTVVSLRPAGQHAALRRAAAARAARLIALSPQRIEAREDAATRADLRAALAASLLVFTSPNAMRAAARLRPLRPRRGQVVCAVGEGTARALRRAGLADVASPARMDSEGLLALPALAGVRGRDVGLITAPGGRDRIAAGLRARGARVLRADVYAREPVPLSPRALAALRRHPARLLLALSSGEALQQVLATAPADILRILRGARVLAASERLLQVARDAGFADVRLARSARPRELIAAA